MKANVQEIDWSRSPGEIDVLLGLNTCEIEKVVADNENYASERRPEPFMPEYWRGLPVQTLLTPYSEIRDMLNEVSPKPNETVVDLGSGYGRMGHVIGRDFPEVNFVGYEYVTERVLESRRSVESLHYPRVKFVEADLSEIGFTPCLAEYYFMYDFGSRGAIEKTIGDLAAIAAQQKITVIGRGRSTRNAIERKTPWLSQIVAPRHFKTFSIYQSR